MVSKHKKYFPIDKYVECFLTIYFRTTNSMCVIVHCQWYGGNYYQLLFLFNVLRLCIKTQCYVAHIFYGQTIGHNTETLFLYNNGKCLESQNSDTA